MKADEMLQSAGLRPAAGETAASNEQRFRTDSYGRSLRVFVFPCAAIVFFLTAVLLPGQEGSRPDALQLWRQGEYERAVDVTLEEIRDNPRNLDSYTVLGWSLLDLGRWADARAYAQEALQIARYDFRIIGILGIALYRLGDNQQALQYLQEYVQLQPQSSRIDQIYAAMGEILIRFGEFNRADIALTTAVHHSPRNTAWWLRLGFAREQARNISGALSAYRQVLSLQPGSADARSAVERLETN